jgi:hypothetical protein
LAVRVTARAAVRVTARAAVRAGVSLVLFALAACGFQTGGTDDLGVDLASPPGADLASPPGADLASPPGVDLAGADLASMNGPGPLGALPSGYCCSSSDQCRSRFCTMTGSGAFFCADPCNSEAFCDAINPATTCEPSFYSCQFLSAPYTCTDPATFIHGGKPTGACCTNDNECLGGWCWFPGGYCTQGCSDTSACPGGYSCQLQIVVTNNPGVCLIGPGSCT